MSDPSAPRTLCIDVGGTGLKAAVLDARGELVADRVRVETPRPATPEAVVGAIEAIGKRLGDFDRISVGFPGVVVGGTTRSAPNLDGEWADYRLADDLALRLGKPARVANDADTHGLAAIEGKGVEMVITLGTGMGSALYVDGRCLWNLELGRHPFEKGRCYEAGIGEAERVRIGKKKWRKRVARVLAQLAVTFNFRKLYVGGGNASRLDPTELPPNVVLVDNSAGLLGGLRLWDAQGSGTP